MSHQPVWVTREEEPNGPCSAALQARGLRTILEPVLARRVVADPADLLAGLSATDWLVLTSPFAIDAVAAAPQSRVPQVAVVGESSRQRALAHGLRVQLVGADGHGATVFAELRARVLRGRVCYPRSAQAQAPEAWADVEVHAPVLYQTLPREFDPGVARRCALAAVASPSAVAALAKCEIPLASIGRATSAAIRRQGRAPVAEAAYPTFEGLADAITAFLRR
jgi:uroporphyrinogen-III synthase